MSESIPGSHQALARARSMGSKIVTGGEDIEFYDPNQDNLVSRVSIPEPSSTLG